MSKALIDRYLRAVLPNPTARFRDPLGRKAGESLDPLRFTKEQLAHKRKVLGPRTWSSVWMQDPRSEGTGLLHRSHFIGDANDKSTRRILTLKEFAEATEGLAWVRFWDLAYTPKQYNKPDPDWSVGSLVAARVDDYNSWFTIYIANLVRFRLSWGDTKLHIRQQAHIDGTKVRMAVEANGPQTAAYQDLRGDPSLSDFIIDPFTAHLDPEWLSGVIKADRIWLCDDKVSDESGFGSKKWHSVLFDEGESYPNGTHDDTLVSIVGGGLIAVQLARKFEAQSGRVPEGFLGRKF